MGKPRSPYQKTPYERLVVATRRFVSRVVGRKRIPMTRIPKDSVLKPGLYTLNDVYYRTDAAQKLGFSVEVSIDGDGSLVFSFVEKVPEEVDGVDIWR